jgi:8-oxo-dGTP pyrophosphatase MutT (NUDIX family)
MFPYLTQNIQDELAQLALAYHQPLVRKVDLASDDTFDPLRKRDGRYGEVCMVVQRTNGQLLTIIKTSYPPGTYRLPTGGINPGERILDALLRETVEETGLQVVVRRFLAAIAYRTKGTGEQPVFYTFAFLLDEVGGELGATDVGERIEDFREIEPVELVPMAQQLSQLEPIEGIELDGRLRDWGEFRAVIHRAVWESLRLT